MKNYCSPKSLLQKEKASHRLAFTKRFTELYLETFGDDRYVYYLDGIIVSWVYTCAKTHQNVHFKYVQFISFLNKAIIQNKIRIIV